MASVFLYHVVGDLTVGKPELVEFYETDTIESAIRAIGDSTECGIPVWKKKQHVGMENTELRQHRFVGLLTPFDIVAYLARSECMENQEKALKTPVSEVIVPNNSLLKHVDPATRLIDALEMMKQGVRRLLVPKSNVWKGTSKRFSVIYNGKWLKNIETGSSHNLANLSRPSTSSTNAMRDKFCCLSREDILRFLIGCLGALAPHPLSSILSVGAVNHHYTAIDASLPAIEVTKKLPGDPCAFAVVETTSDGQHLIIGEISASKLWKCDYLGAAWALANLSAGQFVMGVEDNVTSRLLPDFSAVKDENSANGSPRPRKFSSKSIGFNPGNSNFGIGRNMYRGRSAPLTCKPTSSLAAVMAQMLSHRATHVWVIEDDTDDVIVGLVGYADILYAVTKPPATLVPGHHTIEPSASGIEIHN